MLGGPARSCALVVLLGLLVVGGSASSENDDVTLVQDLSSSEQSLAYAPVANATNASLHMHIPTTNVPRVDPSAAPQYNRQAAPGLTAPGGESKDVKTTPPLSTPDANGGAPQNATSVAPINERDVDMSPPKKAKGDERSSSATKKAPKKDSDGHTHDDEKKDKNGELPVELLADHPHSVGESFAVHTDIDAEHRINEAAIAKNDKERKAKRKKQLSVKKAKTMKSNQLKRRENVKKREMAAKYKLKQIHKIIYERHQKVTKSSEAKSKAAAVVFAPIKEVGTAPTNDAGNEAVEVSEKQKVRVAEYKAKHKAIHKEKSNKLKKLKAEQKQERAIAFPKPRSTRVMKREEKEMVDANKKKPPPKPHTARADYDGYDGQEPVAKTRKERLKSLNQAADKRQKALNDHWAGVDVGHKGARMTPAQYHKNERKVKKDERAHIGPGGVPESKKWQSTEGNVKPPKQHTRTQAGGGGGQRKGSLPPKALHGKAPKTTKKDAKKVKKAKKAKVKKVVKAPPLTGPVASLKP